jgi:hypothetical protein
MSTFQLIQHGAVWGVVFGLVFCAATLILGRINAAMLVNEYPPDVRAKFGAMDAQTRRQANLASLPLLIVLGAVIVFALASLRKQTSELTVLDTFIVAVTMFQVWNVLDLLLLDWFLLLTLQPRFMILPGTEGMAGYRDYGFHFRKFLNGIALTTILGGIVTLIALAVEWVV